MSKIDPKLYGQLEKLISSMGYELFGYELLPRGRRTLFRIYIDSKNGVTIDDCSRVSHQVSAMLDVEDPFQRSYILEISSPGINRPLLALEHYQKYIGKQVKIHLYTPVNQCRHYKGIIQRVAEERIYLLTADSQQEVILPFDLIKKANLIEEPEIGVKGRASGKRHDA